MSEKPTASTPWPTMDLRDVATCRAGFPSLKSVGPTPRGLVRAIYIQDITDRGGIHSQLKEVPCPEDAERYSVAQGDILLIARGSQPRTALVPDGITGSLAGPGLIIIRPGEELLARVLLAYLQGDEGQRALRSRSRGSTATRLITMKDVNEIPVPVPPLEVQVRISKIAGLAEIGYLAALAAAEKRWELSKAVLERLLQDNSLLKGLGP